jgi:hypothetical protein
MTYEPRPIDTSGIELDPELLELVERLAAHNHDIWAEQRIAEGWSYGEARNDEAKTHPDLVPYDELPDSEKEYDRRSVVKTLKAIVSLGYRVRRG